MTFLPSCLVPDLFLSCPALHLFYPTLTLLAVWENHWLSRLSSISTPMIGLVENEENNPEGQAVNQFKSQRGSCNRCGPRSDPSWRSRLMVVGTVCNSVSILLILYLVEKWNYSIFKVLTHCCWETLKEVHRETVQTQIRRCIMRHLIRVSIVC